MSKSKIEWTEHTWNPTAGCSLVSPGCTNCYAMKTARRFDGMGRGYDGTTQPSKGGPAWTGVVNLLPERLSIPLKRRKPTTWFVNSMSDLFHESIPFEFIAAVFGVMAACPQHTFQVLTKRPERAREFFDYVGDVARSYEAVGRLFDGDHEDNFPDQVSYVTMNAERECGVIWVPRLRDPMYSQIPWPLPNVWLGTSVEDQQRADERIPELLRCPAAVRFLSVEPLLGAVMLCSDGYHWLKGVEALGVHENDEVEWDERAAKIDWVIVGGESGPGARPMHPAHPRWIRDQCVDAGVPFFFKQWGSWKPTGTTRGEHCFNPGASIHDLVTADRVGKKVAGRELDGRTWDEMPGQAREAVT